MNESFSGATNPEMNAVIHLVVERLQGTK